MRKYVLFAQRTEVADGPNAYYIGRFSTQKSIIDFMSKRDKWPVGYEPLVLRKKGNGLGTQIEQYEMATDQDYSPEKGYVSNVKLVLVETLDMAEFDARCTLFTYYLNIATLIDKVPIDALNTMGSLVLEAYDIENDETYSVKKTYTVQ